MQGSSSDIVELVLKDWVDADVEQQVLTLGADLERSIAQKLELVTPFYESKLGDLIPQVCESIEYYFHCEAEKMSRETTTPNQETGLNQEKTTPNQQKTAPNREKTAQNQEKTAQNQEKTLPSQEKMTRNKVKAMQNLEKTAPSQEKTTRNQEKSSPTVEKTISSQEKMKRDQEKMKLNQQKTMSSQQLMRRYQEKMKLNQEKTKLNQEKTTPNQEEMMSTQEEIKCNQEMMKLNQQKTTPNQEKMMQEKTTSNQGKIANGLSNPRKRKVSMPKRILASNHEEAGVEESVKLGEIAPLKKGRWQITNGRIPVKVRDVDVATEGKAMVANGAGDVENVIEPRNKFESLVDKSPSEPQSLPSENDTACVVFDEGTQNQSLSGTQTAPLVDKDPITVSEPRSLPSVEESDVVLLDCGRKKQPENKARANAIVEKSPMIPSEPQSSVEKAAGDLLDEDNEKRPENGTAFAPALVDEVALAPSEPEKLPFVKNTVLWKTIEAMEVFQRLPQKPHFQPLENFKENSREGLAIGYMVTFSSLVERASKLQLNDPVSVIDDIKETLTDLEIHGFDVRPIQDRINELLAMKDKEEKLVNNAQTLNSQITEHTQEKIRIESVIDEINGHIQSLQMKLAQAQSAKEKENEEIAFLQVRVRETEDSIITMKNDFEGIVSSIL